MKPVCCRFSFMMKQGFAGHYKTEEHLSISNTLE